MKRSPVTPSLLVTDVAQTVRYYTEMPGFTQTGSDKDESGLEIWAEVTLDEARIWFFSGAAEGRPQPVFTGLIYVFVEDVDAMAAAMGGKVTPLWGPVTQEYGLRELGIVDCNGYMIVFAKDV
jgi:hypothetical protein